MGFNNSTSPILLDIPQADLIQPPNKKIYCENDERSKSEYNREGCIEAWVWCAFTKVVRAYFRTKDGLCLRN